MIQKTFNLTSTFKSEIQEDGSVMVRGMASTMDFDRAGDSIMSEAWTKGGLGNFEKNPIILFNHDYNKPIGRATKVTPTADGLHMEAKISKHAECAELIKDGVLGAFSVGFKVKDADYIKETDGLQIKDAELFEVSVVSIPCNQAATFSLAKSFDSNSEYEDFKKTFKSEENSSSMETDMSEETKTPEVDLEAFAKKVAEETAAKIAMKQAEQKTAEAEAAKAAQDAEVEKAAQEAEVEKAALEQQEKVASSIRTGIESGTERLVEDLRKEFTAKDAETQEILNKYKAEIEEKSAEIQAIQNSKRQFTDRASGTSLESIGQQVLEAKILGSITRRGWDTDYAKDLLEKNIGVDASTGNSISLDTTVATQFEKELMLEMRAASLFREIPVTSSKTVLPLQPDSVAASFASGAPASPGNANTSATLQGSEEGSGQGTAVFNATQKVLTTGRMSSTTYLDNDIEENTLVALLPMVREGLVRAHARAMDKMVISGYAGGAGTAGNEGVADASATALSVQASPEALTGANVLSARSAMLKYGLNPSELALIVSFSAYNDLLSDGNFQDITEVGSDLAIKVTGVIGSIFAIPVIVSDEAGLSNNKGGANVCAVLCNHRNFVIPRLRGVNIETEYQVGNQRTALVASQSLGFEALFAGSAAHGKPSQTLAYIA